MKNKYLLSLCIRPAILFLGAMILCYYNFLWIGLIVFLLFLYDGYKSSLKLNFAYNDLNSLTNKINEELKNNLVNLINPLVVIKENGTILWHNKIFKEIKKSDNLVGESIRSISKDLEIDTMFSNNSVLNQKLRIGRGVYEIINSNLMYNGEKVALLHFNEIKPIKDSGTIRDNIMVIEVDNLNEALETTDEDDKPLVIAEIDRTMTSYANKLKAMIIKSDKNRFILSVEDRYIEGEIESKFKILDDISKISKGNKLEVTLSIGVGRGGISPAENQSFATVAKELALGRGGDQAVVKNNEDIKFFGGNTKEIEKRTRVRARVVSHALKELIYDSKKIFIVGHLNPDMDCFGAAVGMASIIRQLGKNCNIILGNDISPIEFFLGKLKKNKKYEGWFISSEEARKELNNDALVIVVDVHNRSYISNLDLVEKAKRKVIIDHHRRSPDMLEGALLNYIEVYASSTSEMVTEMIQYMLDKPKIGALEAEGLLAGIFMDTKGFSFKTGVRTFEAASFLRNMGADTIEIKKMFTDNLEDYLQIAEIIKSAKVERSIAIAVAPKKVNSTVIVAKAADELLNISGILASFVLAEINGEIFISGRSIGDINVQVILEALGGGGHMNIAGAKVSNSTMEEVINKLKESMTKNLRVGD